MRSIPCRFVFLACLALLMACGGQSKTPTLDTSIALPGSAPSWIAGTRAEPTGGRLVVGLLLPQREARRLADLIPADKLQAFLDGRKVTVETPREIEWESSRPSYRTWGAGAKALGDVAKALRSEHGVEVVFREVLADECADLPLVVVGARPLRAYERRILAAHRKRGGRILPLGRSLLAGKVAPPALLVRQALASVIADSPLLHVLPVDPLVGEARREGDDVVLTLPHPGTSVALEDGTGRALATAVADSDGVVRLRAPDPALDPFSHHVVVRWEGEGLALTRAASLAELVGTIERVYAAPDKVHAGGTMALRIRTTLEGQPAADCSGRIEIVRGKRVLTGSDYRTDDRGLAHPRLILPSDVAPGTAVLRCDGLEHALEITTGVRLSVVTDRPLYKQTDEVHVRVMAHRVGDGRPVAGQELELSIDDAKRKVTTSEHGIASHTFKLMGARVGRAAVYAKGGGAKQRCLFRVKAFERPTFTVSAEPAELTLRPGEAAPVTLTATYVNGSPLVGGNLSFDLPVRLQETPNRFDALGKARMVVRAPTKGPGGTIEVLAQDVDGRIVSVLVPVRIKREGPRLGIFAISDVVVGVPARFLVTSSEPGTLRLGGAFEGPRSVEVGESGRALVTLTPESTRLMVRVIPTQGTAHERTFKAASASALRPALALDRRTARVGETLHMALRSSEPGLVYVDIWRDATAVRTLAVDVGREGADLDLELDASLAGVLRIFARRADGRAFARRATVLVTRGRALAVTAAAAAESYAPGATAAVDVEVRTAAGEPTAAVLGYWAVDEALLALAPATDGHEQVFDVTSPHARLRELQLAEQTDRGDGVLLAEMLRQFGDREGGAPLKRAFPIVLERTPRLVAAAAHAREKRFAAALKPIWDAYEQAWKDMPVTQLATSDSVRETLQWLARQGRFDPVLLLDPWGTPYRLWSDRRSVAIRWSSAGPDRCVGTADDLLAHWSGTDLYELLPERIRDFHVFVQTHFQEPLDEDLEEAGGEPVIKDEEIWDAMAADGDMPPAGAMDPTGGPLGAAFEGPSENSAIGLAGGAGGRFAGRGGGRDLGTGGGGLKAFGEAPVHLRKDFDPTLCFVPEAIVGPDGKSRLSIPLKDSMTTWRLRLVASSADGAVGVGTGRIRVKQAVHANPWLAPHLTVGDVVDVPVAIRNEEAFPVEAQVSFGTSEHLRLLSAAAITVPLEAGATGRALFRIEAMAPGRAPVTIAVDTGGAQDRLERSVSVHRDARSVVAVANGSVTADMAFPTRMDTAGPGDVRVDLYPSPLTEILSGFDGLIRAPHG